jgi:cell division protein FtsI (penicillin-binding protein 3)
MGASKSRRKLHPAKVRIALVGLAVVAAWIGMGYRLVQIQVVQAADLAEQGLNQRFVSRDLAPQRGKIFDRNGELLAMTVQAQSLYAVPGQVEEPLWLAQQVGGLVGADTDVLYERLTSERDFVYIKRQVDRVLAEQVLGMEIRGVYALPEPTRIYPAGAVASHVTGFVDIDGAGQEGLELVYDEKLTGVPGKAEFERALDGAEACWVVVLDAESGEVLAMTGAPVFDPETRQTVDPGCASADDPATCRAFSNFIIRGVYEPGSTQKLITVAAAIEEGQVSIGTVIPEVTYELEILEGACRLADDELYGCYRDFKKHETEDMSVAEIFTKSSNIGTIKIADTIGQDRLIQYIEGFGLGAKTGVDYTVEAPGILNFEAGCETCWASAAIGYSVAATPLQMAAAYATIANDGVWMTPHIVSSMSDADGETEVAGIETRQVVSSGTATLMRSLLASVVENGTGQSAAVDGYRVGGKTGTANKLGSDGRYTEITRASFVGMAPINDPQIVVAVLIDAPSFEYRTGGLSAGPVFAEVMEQALHRLGVTPDGGRR